MKKHWTILTVTNGKRPCGSFTSKEAAVDEAKRRAEDAHKRGLNVVVYEAISIAAVPVPDIKMDDLKTD